MDDHSLAEPGTQVTRAIRESERLAALADYKMLDTPRERDFDEIAELASEICGTPIAVVNLIGEGRQFFKAEVGLGVRETPIDSSFCAKAILEEDFLIVPDATRDHRFDCNPLVTGAPGLRFYAGALLKTDAGHAIGTVCVLDFQPRNLTPLQEKTLRVLARQVMRQLELRKVLAEQESAKAHQDVLNNELAHRMKNTLAVVQAIASQTLRGVRDREAVEAFKQRISALGASHDLLLKEHWTAAPLRRVIKLLLDLHNDVGQISTDGPDIELGPKATVSISLVLHELATNALKYGALSVPGGSVQLSWDVQGDELVLTWRELGGPFVIEPMSKGFGSRLIQLGLVGKGGVDMRYLPNGLTAIFRATMEEVRGL